MILRNINKSYNNTAILKDFSLSIEEGKTTCILGKSGCGKTTLLHILSGIIEEYEGIVDKKEEKETFLFQEDRLLPWRDALGNLTVHHISKEKGILYLDKVLLEGEYKKMPHQLSGGMKRRLAIGRTLAYGGWYYYLDEPCRGLDLETKETMLRIIGEEIKDKTSIIITHDPMEAYILGDTILMMDGPPLILLGEYKKGDFRNVGELIDKIKHKDLTL